MVIYTLLRRVLTLDLSQMDSIVKNITSSKGNQHLSRNVHIGPPARKPTIRFRKGGRKMISNLWVFESLCLPNMTSIISKKFVEEFRLNGGYLFPVSRFPRVDVRRKIPFVTSIRWYSPDKSKKDGGLGGVIRQSGGGVGKLDAANEQGFFHKVNKSKTNKLKKTLPTDEKDKNKKH